jgi:hypothetical protein
LPATKQKLPSKSELLQTAETGSHEIVGWRHAEKEEQFQAAAVNL